MLQNKDAPADKFRTSEKFLRIQLHWTLLSQNTVRNNGFESFNKKKLLSCEKNHDSVWERCVYYDILTVRYKG